MNPTGFVGRISVEIMIAIAVIMLGVSWYICMTKWGIRLMDKFDNWMGKILNRRNK